MRIRWSDAQAYVSWLSRQTGKPYRLPSESEWEYAARAGTGTKYHWGDRIGRNRSNCDGCGSEWDGSRTAPVGSFSPNAWGLHDMHGNVLEWAADCYNRSYAGAPTDGSAWLSGDCAGRVVRSGGWDSAPRFIRAAYRSRADPNFIVDVIGFRVALTLQVAASGDATLRKLDFEDKDGNAISLSPAFAASSRSYTASVANSLDEITVAPDTNDSNATFTVLDGSGNERTDASGTEAGFQVKLNEGSNTVTVQVTAEDASTTETYTVVLTRAGRDQAQLPRHGPA